MKELIDILERIGAHEYATIEKKYGQEMWKLYVALGNGEIEEDELYGVIEKADDEYYKLKQNLEGLLEVYFITIYEEIVD